MDRRIGERVDTQTGREGAMQFSLSGKKKRAESAAPEYPGERLSACFDPLPADERRRRCHELLEATDQFGSTGDEHMQSAETGKEVVTRVEDLPLFPGRWPALSEVHRV
jgi:hypothetical protein